MSQDDPWAWLDWAQKREPDTYGWNTWDAGQDPTSQLLLEQAGLWNPDNPVTGYTMRDARGPGYQRMTQLLDQNGNIIARDNPEAFDSFHQDTYRNAAGTVAAVLGAGYGIQALAGTGAAAGAGVGAAEGAGAATASGYAPAMNAALADSAVGTAGYGASSAGLGGGATASWGAGAGYTADALAGGGAAATGSVPAATGAAPTAGTAAAQPASAPFAGIQNAASTVGNALLNDPLRTAATGMAIYGATQSGGSGAPNFDANSAIQQQTQANQDTALFNANLNRPNQVTPYGSSTWSLKPGADPKNPQPGDWIQTTSLSPNQQQLLTSDEQLKLGLNGSAQSALGRVNSTLNSPLDLSGAPALGQVSNFTGADRQRIEDALMARLNPGFAQDEEAMRSRVLNTGFELGSEGAMREQSRLDRAKNDARLAAIAQSGQEAERLGNISRADATFQNQSRQQAIEEILAQRALPLNELNSIRSGTQVTMPQFSPVSQSNASTTNVMDALMAQFKGQQVNEANQQDGYNALLAQLATLWGPK